MFLIRNKTIFYGELSTPRQTWRTTPCRLSATVYSIYLQLPYILEAVPPSATWGRSTTARQSLYSEPNISIPQRPPNKIYFDIILISKPLACFYLGFPIKNRYSFLISSIWAAYPFHLNSLHFLCVITCDGEYRLWSSSLCRLLQAPVITYVITTSATQPKMFPRVGNYLTPIQNQRKIKTFAQVQVIIPWNTQQAENKRKSDANEESY